MISARVTGRVVACKYHALRHTIMRPACKHQACHIGVLLITCICLCGMLNSPGHICTERADYSPFYKCSVQCKSKMSTFWFGDFVSRRASPDILISQSVNTPNAAERLETHRQDGLYKLVNGHTIGQAPHDWSTRRCGDDPQRLSWPNGTHCLGFLEISGAFQHMGVGWIVAACTSAAATIAWHAPRMMNPTPTSVRFAAPQCVTFSFSRIRNIIANGASLPVC